MFFAKLHPLIVHFPMSLLVTGTLFQLIGKFQNEETIMTAGHYNTWFGFWMLFPAILMGGMSLGYLRLEGKPETFLAFHIRYGIAAFILFSGWVGLQKFRRSRAAQVAQYILLAAGLYCVLAAGFYGGELVYRFGIPVKGVLNP